MKRLKLLVIIVDRSIVDKVTEDVGKAGASFSHISYGSGTAKNDILNILGIGDTEKGIIFCSVTEDKISNVFDMLKEKYNFEKPGRGVAFTIPMTSVGGPATLKILLS